MERSGKILCEIDRSAKILEVGPSYSPVVPKSAGWQSWSVDHSSAEELRRIYTGHDVDVSRIEDVDFVWTTGPMDAAVPPEHHGTFDACIASHVIEHMPDLVGFFGAVSRLLKERSVLSLVVPDKRFCFDYFKPLSTTGGALEAHAARRTRHTKKSAFENAAYNVRSSNGIAWGQQRLGTLSFSETSLEGAREAFERHQDSADAPYADLHSWYFTPSSFSLIVTELAHLGLVDFSVGTCHGTEGCEFFVTLRKGRPGSCADLDALRLELLRSVVLEMKEQADFLLRLQGGAPPADTLEVLASQLVSRLDRLETTLREVAEVSAWTRKALSPLRSVRRWLRRLLRLNG
jgi:SAM-dependent methyltransferase